MNPEQELGRAQDEIAELIIRHVGPTMQVSAEALERYANRTAELLVGSGAVVRAADAMRALSIGSSGPLVVASTKRVLDVMGRGPTTIKTALHEAYLHASTEVTAAIIDLTKVHRRDFGVPVVAVTVERTERELEPDAEPESPQTW